LHLLVIVLFTLLLSGPGLLWVIRLGKIIDRLMSLNADLTLKLMTRDPREYMEMRSVEADIDAPLPPQAQPPLPGAEVPPLGGAYDPHNFPEELVGTISGEEPTATPL